MGFRWEQEDTSDTSPQWVNCKQCWSDFRDIYTVKSQYDDKLNFCCNNCRNEWEENNKHDYE